MDAYLDPKRKPQCPRELAGPALTDGITPLFLGIGWRRGQLARDRQTVLVDVDGDVFGCQTGQLKGCRHGVGILGFVNVQSGKWIQHSQKQCVAGTHELPWAVHVAVLGCSLFGLCRASAGTGTESGHKSVFKETVKLGDGIVVEVDRRHGRV